MSVINSPKAKAETKAYLSKGQTKAITAKAPAGKRKLAQKIKTANKNKGRLSAPSELARCRAIVSGDMYAALLLYRIAYLWRTIDPKLNRNGKEWLAMTREDWATSAGLGFSELAKYALPRLRKYGGTFMEIRAMGRGKDKKMWVTLDLEAYQSALSDGGYEIVAYKHEGLSLLGVK